MIDETKLITALQKGDIFAFNQLYNLYSQKVYNFTLKHIHDEADIEDLIQEVFITIWNRREDLNEDGSFNGYLFTITLNSIRKYYRKKIRNRQLAKNWSSSQAQISDITSDTINYDDINEIAEQIINKLPPKRKEVFILSRGKGLRNDEIAKIMHISKKTVENHLNLALKELRSHLVREAFILTLYFNFFY
jgi:RNA polymerase sigma-70 factor (ECF subfamily)